MGCQDKYHRALDYGQIRQLAKDSCYDVTHLEWTIDWNRRFSKKQAMQYIIENLQYQVYLWIAGQPKQEYANMSESNIRDSFMSQYKSAQAEWARFIDKKTSKELCYNVYESGLLDTIHELLECILFLREHWGVNENQAGIVTRQWANESCDDITQLEWTLDWYDLYGALGLGLSNVMNLIIKNLRLQHPDIFIYE